MKKANYAANGNTRQFMANNNGTITNMQLNVVLKSIGTTYQGIVCDEDGTLFIGSTDKLHDTLKKKTYLEKRDEYKYAAITASLNQCLTGKISILI